MRSALARGAVRTGARYSSLGYRLRACGSVARLQCLCVGVLGFAAGARAAAGVQGTRFPGLLLSSHRSRLALPLAMASASLSADAVAPPSGPDAERLGTLWAEAYEGWVSPPGSSADGSSATVYLAPLEGASTGDSDGQCAANWAPWVEAALDIADSQGGLFALTAFNPMGQEKPHDENIAKNAELEADIKALCAEHPGSVWWRSFGFCEDWHEKGFTIAAPEAKVVALAKKYNQGAVYKFSRNSDTSACAAPIMRATVPALLADTEADVPLVPVSKPVGLERADPAWTPS
mmetsp:Transcript_66040/g.123174  ORF Transcript_66040/g.123174 Transcript_66040/m.123174 type:complete len:291 (+) Transcript_66040:49-921(+)